MTEDRAWVLLKSGRRLDLLNPHPHAWTDDDIATGLARTYRWGGHSCWDLPLSVAQHSLLVLHIREQLAARPLTAAERLRELAHDMDEGLLGYDALTPLKPHLGDGYARLVQRLRGAINARYDLPAWDRAGYEAHKHADRLAAASEAYHVVGWPAADIRDSLGITLAPLTADPVPLPPGLRPWEPWPPTLAARLFLGLLDRLQHEAAGAADDARLHVVAPGAREENPADRPWEGPTHVLVEGGGQTIEGQIVKGVRDPDGAWDLDGVFTVQTEDGGLHKVHGWNCVTEVQ